MFISISHSGLISQLYYRWASEIPKARDSAHGFVLNGLRHSLSAGQVGRFSIFYRGDSPKF